MWSAGYCVRAEGEARGSVKSGDKEKEDVNGLKFSIWEPGGARGKKWAVR